MRHYWGQRKMTGVLAAGVLAATGLIAGSASAKTLTAKTAPSVITVGTLYASTGAFATSSLPQYAGLQFWAKEVNRAGGVYVKPFKKKIKVRIVALNDESNPATATTLYNQLLTQDNVNVLVSDFGSVLTAPAITLAKDQKKLVFDVSGTGTNFFNGGADPNIVLTSLPVSSIWPKPLTSLLLQLKAKRVAILYCQNDFDGAQAQAIKGFLVKGGVTPVYFQGVPTSQTDYSTLLQSIKATNPDAVLELGYPNNDIAFLNELASTGTHFKFALTVFPGQLPALFIKDVGVKALSYTFTYAEPPTVAYNQVNIGLGTTAFQRAFAPADPSSVNFLNVAGYNAGLAVQAALQNATSLSPAGLHAGINAVSGKLRTLEGNFRINNAGAQVGELLPVGQIHPAGNRIAVKIIKPAIAAEIPMVNAKPLYPAPKG